MAIDDLRPTDRTSEIDGDEQEARGAGPEGDESTENQAPGDSAGGDTAAENESPPRGRASGR